MMERKELDFSTLPENYQNKWVALSADQRKVVAVDQLLARAIEKAKNKGEENPVMLKMPPSSGGLVL